MSGHGTVTCRTALSRAIGPPPSWRERLQAWITANLPLPVRTSNWRAVKTFLEPSDLAAYRALLPAPLMMPARPLVLVEFAEVSPAWHEGIVSLACRCGADEGWHGLYWAIDSYFPYVFGRLVGYPKFMADGMTLTRDGARWQGEVRHGGRRHLWLECDAGDGAAWSPDEEALLARIAGPATERPYYLQVPAGRGPWLNRLTHDERISRPLAQRSGRVTLRCDVDDPWAALFPDGLAHGVGKQLETTGTGFGWLVSRRVPAAPGRS